MATEALLETMVTGDQLGNFSMGLQIISYYTEASTTTSTGGPSGSSSSGGSSGGGSEGGGSEGGGSESGSSSSGGS